MTDPLPDQTATDPSRPPLGVWDAMSLLVGIVVGTAIFRAPQTVFSSVHSPLEALGLWVLVGGLTLAGAMCYAELAAVYPRSGGDYEYLSRAYGPWLGLQFATAQLMIVLTGSVGSMAYAFADYAVEFWGLPASSGVWLALGAIGVLTVTNLLGLRAGKATQNLLTVAKLAGLTAIVVCGFAAGDWNRTLESDSSTPRDVGLAMVLIFYAYAGWTHAAYVAAEVEDSQRNLPRTLLVGVVGVTFIYGLVNLAYVLALGFAAARVSATPAVDALRVTIGDGAAGLVSLLVMLSALGAINGTLLTGAYVLAELGRDYDGLRWLCRETTIASPPARALTTLAGVSALLVLGVGTATGQSGIDRALTGVGLAPVPWAQYFGGFNTLVAASAPMFWTFLLLTGTSLFVLRRRDPQRERPFRTPGYPLTPLLFCAASGYMLWASLRYAQNLSWIGLAPISAAAALSWSHRRRCP